MSDELRQEQQEEGLKRLREEGEKPLSRREYLDRQKTIGGITLQENEELQALVRREQEGTHERMRRKFFNWF